MPCSKATVDNISRRWIYLGFEWIVHSSYLTQINTSGYRMFNWNIKQMKNMKTIGEGCSYSVIKKQDFSAKLKKISLDIYMLKCRVYMRSRIQILGLQFIPFFIENIYKYCLDCCDYQKWPYMHNLCGKNYIK